MNLERRFAECVAERSVVHFGQDAAQSVLVDRGYPFVVTHCPALAQRGRDEQRRPARGRANPFDPPDARCFLAAIEPAHNLLFNKYSVSSCHLLLTTQRYESQDDPLRPVDFEAASNALHWLQRDCQDRRRWLFFYNSGCESGASQPHRHLQLIPLAGDGGETVPLEGELERFVGEFGFSFQRRAGGGRDAADWWAGAYAAMLQPLAGGTSTNLLFTRDWMLLVPRRHACLGDSWRSADGALAECAAQFRPNSLIFAGYLLAKSEEELRLIRHVGPVGIIRALVG